MHILYRSFITFPLTYLRGVVLGSPNGHTIDAMSPSNLISPPGGGKEKKGVGEKET
jgi:hypothetical protein